MGDVTAARDPWRLGDFERALQSYMTSSHQALLDEINASGKYDEAVQSAFHDAIKDFKANNTW